MKFPTIHSNGTAPGDLCDMYQAAALAIHDAKEAVAKGCPNARDYYPQEAGAYQTARAEHSARLDKLEAIRTDLEALAMHCADHMPAPAPTPPAPEPPEEEKMLRIFYKCPTCDEEWEDEWTSACDSECPKCGTENIEADRYEELDEATA